MSEKPSSESRILAGNGLVLGRTFAGALIRLPDYCHVLCCGGTGSGKGVSIILPNLLTYRADRLSVSTQKVIYTRLPQSDAPRWERRIIRLAPFNGGKDAFNPLDTIPCDALMVDSARAMAEALVVRQGTESDPHWNDKSVQVICAVLVLVLLMFKDEDRSLNSVQEIVSDPEMLRAAANKLQELGGIPGRLGNQLKTLFDKESSSLTREGAGVLSTVTRHLSFLDSELVAKAVATLYVRSGEGYEYLVTRSFCRFRRTSLRRRAGCFAAGSPHSSVCSALSVTRMTARCCSCWTKLRPSVRFLPWRKRWSGDAVPGSGFFWPTSPTPRYERHSRVSLRCFTTIAARRFSWVLQAATRVPSGSSKSLGDWTQVVESYGENESSSYQTVRGRSRGGRR